MQPNFSQKHPSTHRPIDLILPRLEKARRSKNGWIARCPAHLDKTPSLGVRELDDGRVLIHCFSGCDAADVVAAVGLTLADLFPPRPPGPERQFAPSSNPAFSPFDVLRLIQHEIHIVLAAACTALNGELTREDIERLQTAINRITDAIRLAGVKR
ncbi:putative DNA primase/helicase [Methylomarinovum tepidoasis]|uniref:DNA primase/helicase n=1 Tax=Methylomarinovum tepidoasis TaxID=2840183 RepID=A0AAU9C9C7_9GAMM|nr:DNA primase [Methylomarinovum sp. IN45]BCX88502.1 putative DNA primase/helicase [Methylomarinovum sp. IN45]